MCQDRAGLFGSPDAQSELSANNVINFQACLNALNVFSFPNFTPSATFSHTRVTENVFIPSVSGGKQRESPAEDQRASQGKGHK